MGCNPAVWPDYRSRGLARGVGRPHRVCSPGAGCGWGISGGAITQHRTAPCLLGGPNPHHHLAPRSPHRAHCPDFTHAHAIGVIPLGRLPDQLLHGHHRHCAVFPPRCTSRTGQKVHTPHRSTHQHHLHRADPWCTAVCSPASRGSGSGVLYSLRSRAGLCISRGDSVHALHRRLSGGDCSRRVAIYSSGPAGGREGVGSLDREDHLPHNPPAGFAQRDPGPNWPVHQPLQRHHAGGGRAQHRGAVEGQ